jgi:hypothetical protein
MFRRVRFSGVPIGCSRTGSSKTIVMIGNLIFPFQNKSTKRKKQLSNLYNKDPCVSPFQPARFYTISEFTYSNSQNQENWRKESKIWAGVHAQATAFSRSP